ncbi:MAG: NHL repeat-containing protein [Verrucomicrobiota bacterium]
MKTNPTLAHQLTVLPAAMFSAAMLALSAPAQAQPGPPTVTLQTPTNLTVFAGSNVLIAASAGGVGPFSYQWQLSGTNLPDSIITTVAGNGKQGSSGDGGVATNAELFEPPGVAVDATGNLFIADGGNSRIRKVGTNGIISTVVGNGTRGYLGDGGVATNAELYDPQGVAVDATGDLFIADQYNQRIREVGTNGIITTMAGSGTQRGIIGIMGGYSGDGGAATNAELNDPTGVAVDATGNVFIADHQNNRIREVGTNGIITTVAGNGTNGYLGDGGAATNAELAGPSRVAVDTTGNLFISDGGNYRIREVGTNGIISTVAGNGTNGYSGDGGAATNAELFTPLGVAVDTNDNLFIADESNQRIREVGTNGIITTVAGTGTEGYAGDGGAATNAEFYDPQGVALDATCNLFIADALNFRIRKVASNSNVLSPTLVLNNLGLGNAGAYDVVVSSPYGSVTSCIVNVTITIASVALQTPTNLTASAGSDVTLAVSAAGVGPFSYQWQLNGTNLPLNGIISTVAGDGTQSYSGDGGVATNAELNHPSGVAMDANGNLFIADHQNNRIREVATNGIITTVAGNGTNGYSGDGGAATNAELNLPSGVAVDATGDLFIADGGNSRIREVGTNDIITTVAGNGTNGYSGDGGAATNAQLYGPGSVVVDASGDLFIADQYNQRIREVGTNGIITTVAGNGTQVGPLGKGGYSGDGGAATNAELNLPSDVAVDANGNLFIADYDNQRIREVGTNGIITTVAGNGTEGYSGDGGAAANAELNLPCGIAMDTIGNLLIADLFNDRIRNVGLNGIITTVAGNGYAAGQIPYGGYSGDGGAATNAELFWPSGVALDASGNLLIADQANERIRKVVFNPSGVLTPTLVLNNVGAGNSGAYDVVVSSPYGSVTSGVVNVTVTLPPVVLSAPQITAGQSDFSFLLSGPAGSNYVLQASPDLLNWNSVNTSSIPVSGSITLSNAVNGFNQQFYRVFLQ